MAKILMQKIQNVAIGAQLKKWFAFKASATATCKPFANPLKNPPYPLKNSCKFLNT